MVIDSQYILVVRIQLLIGWVSKSVQGSDCYVETVIAKKVDGEWMIPMSSVVIQKPSEDDKFNDDKINILKKAKDMGLSEKEIEILSR